MGAVGVAGVWPATMHMGPRQRTWSCGTRARRSWLPAYRRSFNSGNI